MLRTDNTLKIQIDGHTDSQGNDQYNQQLSEKRAAAVVELLVSKYQIPQTQLLFKGYGESQPVGDNTTEAGRAKNRRVELTKVN